MSSPFGRRYSLFNQVEKKFAASETNRKYRFPGLLRVEDSENSLNSLEDLAHYDLVKQNEEKKLDEIDQLTELFFTMGKLDKMEIRELLESPGSQLFGLLVDCVNNKLAKDRALAMEEKIRKGPLGKERERIQVRTESARRNKRELSHIELNASQRTDLDSMYNSHK